MNKYFLYAASVLALASCSSDDFLGENSGNGQNAANSVINFGGETGKITRAADIKEGEAAELLGKNFVLVGFKGSETAAANTTYAFDHYNVNYVNGTANTTESNTANWEYVNQNMDVRGANGPLAHKAGQQTIKYWDYSCASYDFIAFSMGKGNKTGEATVPDYATPTAVNAATLGTDAYTLTGDANTLSKCYISDMKTVTKGNYSKTAVAMSFRHLTSKVRIALYETVPGYVISDVMFYNVATGGTGSDQGTLFGTFNNHGTLTVYFPTTGTANAETKKADYNKAHVKFSSTETDATVSSKDFGTVNYNNKAENEIKDANDAIEKYLGQTSTDPSYCGAKADNYYQTVLPAEGKSMPANLRIDYKLTATDGTGEVIYVKGATATVPAKYTEWKPGYAYTYIFKISQNTNGTTGNPGDPSGLTAISFDAVVLEDEQNGLQETITTVSDPSITTYGFKDGSVTVNGGEYEAGTDIYATVHVPGATTEDPGTTAEPTALYTVTITKDPVTQKEPAQTINEASVANALKDTNKQDDNTTWKVTDANGAVMEVKVATGTTPVTTVPTQDGHGLAVKALKWRGVAGTYAVEYVNGANKYYKIVTVK